MLIEDVTQWEAQWIWTEGLPRTSRTGEHEMAYFRRSFHVPGHTACRLVARVTADSRYRLYLNGESVSVGPCKGDRHTHYYETVDLSERLVSGRNVLAAEVLHYTASEPFMMGEGGPISVWRSQSGGFLFEGSLLDGDGVEVERLHSDAAWKCREAEGYGLMPSQMIQWLGGLESVDGTKLPQGWKESGFDDREWPDAAAFYGTRNGYGELPYWKLARRPIPQMYEHPARFKSAIRSQPIELQDFDAFLKGGGTLDLKPGERLEAELDAGYLTTGYLQLAFQGGRDSRIRILCAECYEEPQSVPGNRRKGVRDQAENGILIGDYDNYAAAGAFPLSGAGAEIYEPFSFRTFRYVRLEIAVGNQPFRLLGFHYRETGYPLDVRAEFECSDASFNQLWYLSLNTLRRCMHETYEDCPYYEQLQYTMDTRLQMLYTYHLSTDDRLARKAIFDYHSSRLPTGMLQSRYPSVYPQVIPGFSLYWILMLDDHYHYFGDLQLIRDYLPTMTAVLDWFGRHRTENGLIGNLPDRYWPFIDWVSGWPDGVPPAARRGPAAMDSLMYACALKTAAGLFEACGWRDAAGEYRTTAGEMCRAVRKYCWSEEQQLFQDGPGIEAYSQHTQIWAILSGMVQESASEELMEKALTDESLSQVSLPMAHFLFRTLDRMGLYHRSALQWRRWQAFLGVHLTTLPEQAHDVPRSDCHAWSAQPLAEFPMALLGIRPKSPGFAEVQIKPEPLHLRWAKGSVPSIRGDIAVEWRIAAGARFHLSVSSPKTVPVTVIMPDGGTHEFSSGGRIELECLLKEAGRK